jgi:hypothetical protein
MDDQKLTKSFQASSIDTEREAILEFFDEYGFIVFDDVFNSLQCQKTRDSMWDIIEAKNPKFDRFNTQTWGELKSSGISCNFINELICYNNIIVIS